MKTTRNTIASLAAAAIAMIRGTPRGEIPSFTADDRHCALPNFCGCKIRFLAILLLGLATWPDMGLAQADIPTGSLAGYWRCTTLRYGSTADHHMMLNANGFYRYWSRSFSSYTGREQTTAPVVGRWTVRGSAFIFASADGEVTVVPFQQSGATILLPNEQSRRIWERVR